MVDENTKKHNFNKNNILEISKLSVEEAKRTFPDGESIECKWVSIETFMNMFNKKEIVPTIDIEEKDLKEAVKK